ncbi:lambda-crystallin homolog [Gigantopelta aegis]|uniref:lambda-crystallin homolog n=1 Tax=Gigantopelta aegis TaxID=1735272 RepID=UPI001B88D5F2|nr:lambda-crystallin homolog [Gigantopelta aegis]
MFKECIPEDLERKRELLKTIERHVQQDTIIVSFASALLPSLLSEHLDHKENFVVVHSLKPTLLIKSTEVVPSPWTNTNTLKRLTKILEGLGLLPIVLLKEIDGYTMNRIHYCLMAECYHLVKGGYCDAVDVDTAMQEGLGQWYPFLGLFEIEHLNADGFVALCKRYGNAHYEVQKSFLPPERMEGATAKAIHNSLCEIVPLDMLEEQRRFRIKALAALQKMKDDLDVNDP